MSIDLEREREIHDAREEAAILGLEKTAQGNDRVALQLEIQVLQAQLEKRNRMLFAPSSERRPGETDAEPKARAPKKGHGPREQPQLRIVIDKHVLELSDRVCIMRKGSLEDIGDQVRRDCACAAATRSGRALRARRKRKAVRVLKRPRAQWT